VHPQATFDAHDNATHTTQGYGGPMTGVERRGRADGSRLSRVTSGIVHLHAQNYGKGPTQARSYLVGDVLICVMHDGLIPAERTLIARGAGETVAAMRRAWQESMRDSFREIVEAATERRVRAVLSQVNLDADIHIEVFILEPDPDGV
jgi:uncharacterized protein YbcI